jgi:hypothetical protein
MRGIPYSQEEIAHLLEHPNDDYGELADSLNELYFDYNRGTRSRDGVGQWLSRKRQNFALRVVKIPKPLYDAVGGPSLDVNAIMVASLTILLEAMKRKARN